MVDDCPLTFVLTGRLSYVSQPIGCKTANALTLPAKFRSNPYGIGSAWEPKYLAHQKFVLALFVDSEGLRNLVDSELAAQLGRRVLVGEHPRLPKTLLSRHCVSPLNGHRPFS